MSQPPVQSDDQMAELTERARSISRDASTKVTSAFREMISAGAGIAGFAVESAKDLVQYMVRRGQMTQEEADKLIREAEAAHLKRPKAERERMAADRAAAEKAAFEKKAARSAAENALPANKPLSKTVKMPPLKSGAPAPEPVKVEKPAAKPEKAGAKAAAPKAEPVKAAGKSAAPAKAPSKAAAPVKAAAKAPAKKVAAPAKAAAKKTVKKKK